MPCPYLSRGPKRECVRMLEAKINGDLSDFDLKHFCEGDPIYCYYFRLSATSEAIKSPMVARENATSSMTPEIQKKVPLAEFPFRNNESL